MMELFVTVFSAAFFVTVIRTTTPLLLATLGGLIADLSRRAQRRARGPDADRLPDGGDRLGLCALVRRGGRRASAPARCSGCSWRSSPTGMKADIILVGFAINILAAGGTVFALTHRDRRRQGHLDQPAVARRSRRST